MITLICIFFGFILFVLFLYCLSAMNRYNNDYKKEQNKIYKGGYDSKY